MRELIVLLDVETPIISESAFLKVFGAEGTDFEVRVIGNKKLWRAESKLGARASLFQHAKAILKQFPIHVSASRGKTARYKAHLNVGVMYDTYTASLEVAPECVELLSRHGVGLQICTYPTEFQKRQVVVSRKRK